MVKSNTKYTLIIIVLSVLLTISLVVGATFAWFISSDSATATITFGEAVTLNIETDNEGKLPIQMSGPYLLPGMNVKVDANAIYDRSTTPAILRARVAVDIDKNNVEIDDTDIDELRILITEALKINKDRWLYYKATIMDENDQPVTDGGWWYYYDKDDAYYTDNQTNAQNPATYGDVVLTRILSDSEDVASRTVKFFDSAFTFPTGISNAFAGIKITINVTFQTIQGVITYPGDEHDTVTYDPEIYEMYMNGLYRINYLDQVIQAFQEQFGN